MKKLIFIYFIFFFSCSSFKNQSEDNSPPNNNEILSRFAEVNTKGTLNRPVTGDIVHPNPNDAKDNLESLIGNIIRIVEIKSEQDSIVKEVFYPTEFYACLYRKY